MLISSNMNTGFLGSAPQRLWMICPGSAQMESAGALGSPLHPCSGALFSVSRGCEPDIERKIGYFHTGTRVTLPELG